LNFQFTPEAIILKPPHATTFCFPACLCCAILHSGRKSAVAIRFLAPITQREARRWVSLRQSESWVARRVSYKCHSSLLKSGLNESERIKTRITQEVDRTHVIQDFQKQIRTGHKFSFLRLGVRLFRPHHPYLFSFIKLTCSVKTPNMPQKRYSVIKVAYFFASP
jgi:hypothetical protein